MCVCDSAKKKKRKKSSRVGRPFLGRLLQTTGIETNKKKNLGLYTNRKREKDEN